uniref:Uncharacterized protein n=1 Tax=Anguilla anguilla TaxID=7936 RepID=A0A0E9PIP1_ANGAN
MVQKCYEIHNSNADNGYPLHPTVGLDLHKIVTYIHNELHRRTPILKHTCAYKHSLWKYLTLRAHIQKDNH